MNNVSPNIAIWAISDPLIRRKILPAGGCWLWTGSITEKGYGQIVRDEKPRSQGTRFRRKRVVHRVVYEDIIGPIPPGHELHHKCWNRHCANPSHVEPLTHEENVRRGVEGTA